MGYRKLFILSNVAVVGVLLVSFAMDYDREWKKYQRRYLGMAADAMDKKAAAASGEEAKLLAAEAKKLRGSGLEIKQIIAKDLGRVDRCITCHVGMDEYVTPTLKNDFTEHPYKSHPQIDALGRNHPFSKYGCTVCHQGQGLATESEDAHGFVHNWEKPLLKGPLIQGSCVKCHDNYRTLK
ncbi:MAG: hypothetical protein HY549_00170, partial [Elusimicrobia bacterium]|nr:hypothetical protein [Elusimicrobiota bacterium]